MKSYFFLINLQYYILEICTLDLLIYLSNFGFICILTISYFGGLEETVLSLFMAAIGF